MRRDVLLLDPFTEEAEMYCEYLRAQGFGVRLHRDAQAALQSAAATRPDIVVTRLRQEQSDIDGFEVTRRLKRSASTRHVPVVVLTTSMLARDADAAIMADCDAYLLLPVTPDDLVAELNRLLPTGGGPPPMRGGGS